VTGAVSSSWIVEREHVDAEGGQPGDLAVGHAALVEQADRLFQVRAAWDAEAEMVQAHPIRVEAVRVRGHRPQPHDQVAADHDHAAEQDLERLGGARVVRRRRLHGDLEAQQAGVELAAALHVGDGEPEVVDVAQGIDVSMRRLCSGGVGRE
jgi:hypothetical protein